MGHQSAVVQVTMHKQPQLCKPFIILQIWQPWASYAVSGHMRMLGRGWPGDFEGQIWIVVANKNRDMGSDVAEVEKLYREICQAEKRPFQPIQTFPKQGILGCVEVVACHPAEQLLAWDSLPASRRAEVNAPHCFLVDNAMRLDEPLMCDLASAGRLFFGNRLSCPVDGEPPQCPFSLVAAANKKKPESIARVLNQQRGLLPPRPLSRSFSLDKRHLLHDLSAEPEEGQHQASAARQGSKRDATDLRRSSSDGGALASLTRKLPASKVDWRLDPTAPDTPSSRFIKLGRIAVEAAQRAEHGKAQCSLPAMEAAALGDAGAADRDMPVCTYRVPSIFGDKYHEAESPPSSPKCKTRLFSASNDGTRVGNLQTTQVKLPECQPPQHNHALAPACGDGYDAQKSDAAPTDSLPSKTQLPQAQSSLHQGLKTAAAACAGSPSSPAQSRFADLFELQHDPPASFGGPVWDNSYASCHGDVAMPDVQPCKLTNAAAAASSGSIKRCSSFSFTKLDAYWSAPMRDGFQPQRISSDVSSAQQVDPYSGKISTDTDMLYCEESYGQPGYNSMQEVFPNSSVPESNHALNAISLLSKQLDGCTITEKGGHASAQLHSQAIRSDANVMTFKYCKAKA
ncbi:hypothetical protein WJX72_005615 [[Myrmecia] bisecta]|uniref:Uncharacterized protein n=1 Tax=[Myrmecia] bisecta TaxID=41462 RepID=A0AAW1Q0C5_9CHLO